MKVQNIVGSIGGYVKSVGLMLAVLILAGCSASKEKGYSEFIDDLMTEASPFNLTHAPTKQRSSYDRSGGNNDFNYFPRPPENGWATLADLRGAGCLTRLWMTGITPDQKIRFIVDGDLEHPFEFSWTEMNAGKAPFFEALGRYEQKCLYFYIPVPYQKQLTVQFQDRGYNGLQWPRGFYQMEYMDRTDMPKLRFPATLSARDMQALEKYAHFIQHAEPEGLSVEKVREEGVVSAGEKVDLVALEGPCIIRNLEISVQSDDPAVLKRCLREIILEIRWDDALEPSVRVPLGDFFGSIGSRTRFSSRFIGMQGDTFFTHFPMPFAEKASIAFVNRGAKDLGLRVELGLERVDSLPEHTGYFHASWKSSLAKYKGSPHKLLNVQGRGKYMGCMLRVANPDPSWWILEGDDRMWIDGEILPSRRGTGLEDYFNGGWYYQNPKARPLHGMIYKVPFSTVQYRFHLADLVGFEQKFAMEFERGGVNDSRGLMESVAYYYLEQPSKAVSDIGPALIAPPFTAATDEKSIMVKLLGKERLGDLIGAGECLDELLQRFPDLPKHEILELRSLMYRILTAEETQQVGLLESFIASCSGVDARAQAELLLQYFSGEEATLVGAFCNGPARVYIDGQLILNAKTPGELFATVADLSPGDHVIAIEADALQAKPWVQVSIHGKQGEVLTGTDWRYSASVSAGWNTLDFNAGNWPVYEGMGVRGPPDESTIYVEPNAFVGLQSTSMGIRTAGWGAKSRRVYLRKRFSMQ